jgi:hypothetical protein
MSRHVSSQFSQLPIDERRYDDIRRSAIGISEKPIVRRAMNVPAEHDSEAWSLENIVLFHSTIWQTGVRKLGQA